MKKYFTLDSPIEISENLTLRGDLNYYLDFTKAEGEPFFKVFTLDEAGTPINDYTKLRINRTNIGKIYNFTCICMYGLLNLEKYLKSNENKYLDIFLKQVGFLKANVTYRRKQMAIWENTFDWIENDAYLKAPFADAMNQGLAISSLVRAYKVINDESLLMLARDAVDIFTVPIEEGGIRVVEDGSVYYEEYPAYPLTYVLDGSCFGLLGLYDLYVTTGEERARFLFEEGLAGIEKRLLIWDYRGYWSSYGNYKKISGIMYNKVNACLLKILGRISGNKKIEQAGENWLAENLLLKERIDIMSKLFMMKVRG